jgi:citrate lyase subunit gamma (acyl carrier protein)
MRKELTLMSVCKPAQAGTLESNDIMITVAPAPPGGGITIELESIVLAQYGDAIRRVITATLAAHGVADAAVRAVDRGALDCTIRARVAAALTRAGAAGQGGCGR